MDPQNGFRFSLSFPFRANPFRFSLSFPFKTNPKGYPPPERKIPMAHIRVLVSLPDLVYLLAVCRFAILLFSFIFPSNERQVPPKKKAPKNTKPHDSADTDGLNLSPARRDPAWRAALTLCRPFPTATCWLPRLGASDASLRRNE